MKLTLHIIKKDLYRLRWRIAFWLAVLGAKTGLGFALLAGDEPGYLAKHGFGISVALGGLDVGLCYLLTVALVQEDMLVGTRAFLLTRPVSGGRLLGAKLLAAFLFFGVTPVVIWLPWWLHCGYGGHELAGAVGATWFWQAMVVVPAMIIAALTNSLSRMLLWSLVVLAGVPFCGAAMSEWMTKASEGVGESRAALTIGIVVAGVVTAVMRQYFFRQTGRSLTALLVGVALAMNVASFWPWDIFAWSRGQGMADKNTALMADTTLEFDQAQAPFPQSDQYGRQVVDTVLRLRGVPADFIVSCGKVEQRWHWAGGPEFTMNSLAFGRTDPRPQVFHLGHREPDAETQRYYDEVQQKRKAMGVRFPRPGRGGGYEISSSGQAPHSVVMRLAREPADYTAKAKFQLLRPEIWFDEPLATGAWRAHAGTGLRVTVVEVSDNQALIEQVQTGFAPGSQTLWGGVDFNFASNPVERIINRATGDTATAAWEKLSDPVWIGTVDVRWQKGQVHAPMVRRGDQWVLRDEHWFDEARIAVAAVRPAGEFTREARTDKFMVSPPDRGAKR